MPFSTKAEADAWVREQAFPAPDSRTIPALKDYGAKGYTAINLHMRTGLDSARGAQAAFEIKRHLRKSRTRTAVIAARHVGLEAFPGRPDTLIGTTLRDGAPISTTILPDAPHFRGNAWWNKDITMTIHVPAGTRAISMDPYATVRGQHELLLGDRVGLKIISAERGADGKWRVVAEAVPDVEASGKA